MSNSHNESRPRAVRNVFGVWVPPPVAIGAAPAAARLAKRLLRRIFTGCARSDDGQTAVIDDLFFDIGAGCRSEAQLETEFRERLATVGFTRHVTRMLKSRAQWIATQVMPFVREGAILDLGCGDALASGMLAGKGTISLADTKDYRDAAAAQRIFYLVREGDRLPFGRHAFDTVLVLTVLHHSANPLHLMREAIRVCRRGGRVIVIESVFGVSATTKLRPLPGKRTELMKQPGLQTYLSLTRQQQLTYCAFVDWFYNRVLHENVSLPFQYNTPAGWRRIFQEYGLREAGFFHLGLDQVTVPEFHTLHVLDVVP